MEKSHKPLVNFLFELGMLKKIEHCGTKFAGVKYPDTLAEHTCRSAQIGYLLALAENANPEKVSALCLMHDIAEIRVGDAHRIAQRYLKILPAEKKALKEQLKNLPMKMREKLQKLWDEFHEQKTLEACVSRDADLLETILQAKEYLDLGFSAAQRWLKNGGKYLKTSSAKKLFKEIQKTQFTDWWDHLNK
ncbi:HD domain-containing protein [Candidatus Peregrinibacteria bacterium]|nr:HD domain-containing protein [Candidatus Peregrinibacteria bacterium]